MNSFKLRSAAKKETNAGHCVADAGIAAHLRKSWCSDLERMFEALSDHLLFCVGHLGFTVLIPMPNSKAVALHDLARNLDSLIEITECATHL